MCGSGLFAVFRFGTVILHFVWAEIGHINILYKYF